MVTGRIDLIRGANGEIYLHHECGFVRRVGRVATKVAKRGGKLVLAPFRLQMLFIRRFTLPVARQLCRLPSPIIEKGASLASVSPEHVKAFCVAVRLRKMKDIKRFLPAGIAVAAKLAGQGFIPPLVPVFRAMSVVPKPIKQAVLGKRVASLV